MAYHADSDTMAPLTPLGCHFELLGGSADYVNRLYYQEEGLPLEKGGRVEYGYLYLKLILIQIPVVLVFNAQAKFFEQFRENIIE